MAKRSSGTSCMQVHDIEDLAAAGTTNHACPYFAARSIAGTLSSIAGPCSCKACRAHQASLLLLHSHASHSWGSGTCTDSLHA